MFSIGLNDRGRLFIPIEGNIESIEPAQDGQTFPICTTKRSIPDKLNVLSASGERGIEQNPESDIYSLTFNVLSISNLTLSGLTGDCDIMLSLPEINGRLNNSEPEKDDVDWHCQSAEVFAIVQEYCKISKQQNPSEADLERLTAILELAQYDPELSNLINEADQSISEGLNNANFIIPRSEDNNLAAGSYYIQVSQLANDTRYRLSLSPTDHPISDESSAISANDGIEKNPGSDLYRFILNTLSAFRLNCSELYCEADMMLMDSNINGRVDNLEPEKDDAGRHYQSAEVFAIVQEYCKISKRRNPSEADLDRLTAILELAQYDPELSNLINEADHLIAYDLNSSANVDCTERLIQLITN